MNACTFFGHSNSPQNLRVAIKEKITELIEQHGVELFYVGNHGQFDSMALSSLKELAKIYPHISYYVVLAYFPKEKSPKRILFSPKELNSVTQNSPSNSATNGCWNGRIMLFHI
jgi:hypothetical protein